MKKQSNRLAEQHKKTHGAAGIFGEEAQQHDADVFHNSCVVKNRLEEEFPMLVQRPLNNWLSCLSKSPIAHGKNPQCTPVHLRFLPCTLEDLSCAL